VITFVKPFAQHLPVSDSGLQCLQPFLKLFYTPGITKPRKRAAMEWFWAGLNTGRKAFNDAFLKFADVESEPKVLQCVTW